MKDHPFKFAISDYENNPKRYEKPTKLQVEYRERQKVIELLNEKKDLEESIKEVWDD